MIDHSYQGLELGTSPSTNTLDIIGRWRPAWMACGASTFGDRNRRDMRVLAQSV